MSQNKILVVEDEPLIRLCLVEALEEKGFTVMEAKNALKLSAFLENMQTSTQS